MMASGSPGGPRLSQGRPSATAQRVAVRRAEHQLRDKPHVFDDPLALGIIGAEAAATVHAGVGAGESPGARSLRAFIAVRSRHAEDELALAVARGTRQYVVLGAGLDTFAYRGHEAGSGLSVFEVDHPATQAWKRERLESAGIPVPASVRFVPIDFERQSLDAELVKAGFRTDQAAFFSWLGVTPYLENATVIATLELIRGLSAESAVVFDYRVPRESLGWLDRIAHDALAKRVARAGEPFRGCFEPGELASTLQGIGFGSVEDLTSDAVNARYFLGRADGLRIHGRLGRLLRARARA
jgi:methyltransferase (TIGR00027 family)